MKKNEIVEGVTQQDIDGWIAKYGEGKVYCFEVPIDESYEEYIGAVVHDPNAGILNEYLRKSERVPLDAAKTLINTIWLGGDKRIKNERTYLLAFMGQLSEVLVGGQGRTKKLQRSQSS